MRDEIIVEEPIGWVVARLVRYLHSEGAGGVANEATQDQNTVLLRVGVAIASKQVAIRSLAPVVTPSGADIALSWSATGAMRDLYPSLEATISARAVDMASTRITMAGSYQPPRGKLGVGIDQVLDHRIALETVRAFLARVEHRVLNPAAPPSPEPAAGILPATTPQPDEP